MVSHPFFGRLCKVYRNDTGTAIYSLPVVRAGRQFTGVRHRGAGEALEGGRVGVDAEGDAVGVDLVLDEAVQLLLDLGHAGQVALPVVVEGALSHLEMLQWLQM